MSHVRTCGADSSFLIVLACFLCISTMVRSGCKILKGGERDGCLRHLVAFFIHRRPTAAITPSKNPPPPSAPPSSAPAA